MTHRSIAALLLVTAAVLLWGSQTAGPATAAPRSPAIEAASAALVDVRDGAVLYRRDARRRRPIASTTKLMTALLALEELSLRRRLTAPVYAAGAQESLIGLVPGERMTVRDLLRGLLLASANDAAVTLARGVAGSVPRFVGEMNRKAVALGLADTHYANPIGLDQAGNYSSALDLTALTRRLLGEPAFARIAASRSAELRSLRPVRRIETINDFLLEEPWATGVKTGHTFDAGYVLVGAGRRKGVELISAVLGTWTATARDLETARLLEYGFSKYRKRVPIHAGQALAKPSIRYSGGELPLRSGRTVAVGLRRGQRLTVRVKAPEEVEGPLHRGTRLGRAVVLVDGRPAASVPLRAGRAVPKASVLERVRGFLEDNLLWIVLALSAILIAAVLRRRLRR